MSGQSHRHRSITEGQSALALLDPDRVARLGGVLSAAGSSKPSLDDMAWLAASAISGGDFYRVWRRAPPYESLVPRPEDASDLTTIASSGVRLHRLGARPFAPPRVVQHVDRDHIARRMG